MLVLTRRKGESIVIGETVLTLLEAGRGRVRIGIDAPAEISVLRAELVDAVGPRSKSQADSMSPKPR